MGVNVTHQQTSYSVKNLTVVQLNKIIQQRFERRRSVDSSPIDVPTVDIDVSWMVHKASNLSEKGRINHVMRVCDVLCKLGNRVVLVCDGDKRHDTKRATVSRQSIKYKNKIELYLTRCQIVHKCTQVQQSNNHGEKTKLEIEQELLKKKAIV